MAELTLLDGKKEYTDYNTAAKIWQILNGNELSVPKEERPAIAKLASKTKSIDFKKLESK